MTEAEWLAATDPTPMLAFLRSKVSDRKLRLFGVACCRGIWDLVPHGQCRKTVIAAERNADGEIDDDKLSVIMHALLARIGSISLGSETHEYAAIACQRVSSKNELHMTFEAAAVAAAIHHSKPRWMAARKLQYLDQVKLAHEIFGNPFRPVVLDSTWLTSTVVAIARGVYDDRAFDRLPILADALQDAGCENVGLLDHLRGAGPHVRGCWAVDLVLGKG